MKNTVFYTFFITIITILLGIYVIPWNAFWVQVPFSNKEYRLGLDLQGGIELDYKIDLDEYREREDYTKKGEDEVVEGLKRIIDTRVQVLNINDSEITDASYGDERHIIVQIPLKSNDGLDNQKNIEKAKEAIGRVVKIAFKERRTEVTQADLAARKKIAEDTLAEIQAGEDFTIVGDKTMLNHQNIKTGTVEAVSELTETSDNIVEGAIATITNKAGETEFLLIKNTDAGIDYIAIAEQPSAWKNATDKQGRVLDENYFVNSSVQLNQAYQPMVELTFNDEGAKIFGELTERLVGQQMAIFVGGEMLTAPNINEPIYGGKAVITGNYTQDEANELSRDINTGVVPAPIYLVSEKTIDSKIGANSLQQLIVAGVLGFMLIFIFLVVVYRTAGLMAGIALLVYAILILFAVKSTDMVLTLASIAGLVLSFGMAIDANILVFERIKWELKNGQGIENAIDNGFKETWSAIFDSNVTGFIVALILFVFGINMIKWFGAMLGIGILLSFFTVMIISRILLHFIALYIRNERIFIWAKK